MKQIEIKHRWTGAVLYAGGGKTLRDVVEAAVRDGANLAGANLAGAILDGANLAGANLAGANLAGAILDGARLVGASLVGASLVGARLVGASLVGAILDGASLVGAILDGASLAGASLVFQRPVLILGPLGSRCDYLTAYLTDAGVKVRAGCFSGSLDEFRDAVTATHGGSIHGREYAAAIAMIEAHATLWTPVQAEGEAA